MAVLVVVVGEEDLAEGAGAGEGSELAGERRAVLECLELRFAERIIVRHVRPGMALADVQVGEQHGDRLGRHRRAPGRMNGARCDADGRSGGGTDETVPVTGGPWGP